MNTEKELVPNLKNVMKRYSEEKKIKKKDYMLWFPERDMIFTAFPHFTFVHDDKDDHFSFYGRFKTLEADNILWDILKMPENKQ